MFWFVVVAFLIVCIIVAINSEKAKTQAREAYRRALLNLKDDPSNSDLRQHTLALGRRYSNLMRDKKGRTVFDEVALMNDINAACAGAAVQISNGVQHVTQPHTDSVESRLLKLQSLKEAGLIDDQDFSRRKREIMDQI